MTLGLDKKIWKDLDNRFDLLETSCKRFFRHFNSLSKGGDHMSSDQMNYAGQKQKILSLNVAYLRRWCQ